jgi:triacylglycerol lipase
MNIILVHGIFDNSRLLAPMSKALEAHGHLCYRPSLKPSSARLGIADLALKLRDYIDTTLTHDDDFVLVGFSMGCLISRYYLQELEGHQRCPIFHAISGPHHGSWWALLFFWQGAREMRPHSKFLQTLEKSQHRLSHMAIYSYRTPYDLMILPSKSSHWVMAENHVSHTLLHHLMVKNKIITHMIVQSIA